MIDRDGIILVTGSTGMVGSAMVRLLKAKGFSHLLTPPHSALDLGEAEEVDAYFAHQRPDYVFMIAAKVGGIGANRTDPVGFLSENVRMENNLFEACYKYRVKKNLFLGSSCIYPRAASQPMKEVYLLTGPLEPTNEGYALAKIVGLKLAEYYYRQYDMLTICPMPCNIYGTNNHFDLASAHVLAALVRRFVDAQDASTATVTLWGTGSARREFIHVEDVARGLLFLMDSYASPEIINMGTGVDISIYDLAYLVAAKVGYAGNIAWDTSKPDGMPRKCLDIAWLTTLGFRPRVSLETGVAQTIAEYRQLKHGGKIT